jgi:hypothetical protein
VQVRLTNNDSGSLFASYFGFRMVDANHTVAALDENATLAVSAHFPESVELVTGESSEGVVIFSSVLSVRPYTLEYNRSGFTAHIIVPEAPPGHTGCGAPPPTQPPTAVLQGSGSWSSNATVSTYTFTVSTVTPTSAQVNPAQLQYIVSDSANTAMYAGAAGQNSVCQGFTVNVVYQDALDAGVVSAGDRIQITVSPVAGNPLFGGHLQVNYDGNGFSTATIS